MCSFCLENKFVVKTVLHVTRQQASCEFTQLLKTSFSLMLGLLSCQVLITSLRVIGRRTHPTSPMRRSYSLNECRLLHVGLSWYRMSAQEQNDPGTHFSETPRIQWYMTRFWRCPSSPSIGPRLRKAKEKLYMEQVFSTLAVIGIPAVRSDEKMCRPGGTWGYPCCWTCCCYVGWVGCECLNYWECY